MVDTKYTLDDLLAMKPSERKEKISEANITKAQFCNELMTNKKFRKLPGKGLVIKRIGTMSEGAFQDFILTMLNKY